jgi:hypothetical protein
MWAMLKVEWNIFRRLRQKQYCFSKCVGVTYLVKDVRVTARHVGDDNVRFVYLAENPIEYSLVEDLLVNSFRIGTRLLGRTLNAELVDIGEFTVEGHEDENEWLRKCRVIIH